MCFGYVDIMLFISFLFALGSQSERDLWWNTGFKCDSTITAHFEKNQGYP